MILRDYQEKAVASVFEYFKTNQGNPLIVAPTGAGKSVIIAEIVKRACVGWPYTRITILAHRMELLEQNAAKLHALWPEGEIGLFSAGLRSKNVKQVTIAGIDSIYRHGQKLGWQDLVIIDEAHRIPKKADGMYRKLIAKLKLLNSKVKIIGLTATPFRTDSGLLTEGDDKIFTDIAMEIEMRPLIDKGFLADLVTKDSKVQADLKGVHVRGGDYVQKEAEARMLSENLTERAIKECLRYGGDRKSWLFFCAGVEHAKRVRDELSNHGINARCVTGETEQRERAETLEAFRNGSLQAVTNCDVLTTGFDAPNIDLLVLLRPTKSVGLYVQMVGRGSRIAPGKNSCMVLDFAGNVKRFGPVDAIRIRRRGGKAVSHAVPTKRCPKCESRIPALARVCSCGHEFKFEREGHLANATELAILSKVEVLNVMNVRYSRHRKAGKPDSMRIDYYCGMRRVSEWICFEHQGVARDRACEWFRQHIGGLKLPIPKNVSQALEYAQIYRRPASISIKKKGEYDRVLAENFSMAAA